MFFKIYFKLVWVNFYLYLKVHLKVNIIDTRFFRQKYLCKIYEYYFRETNSE